MMAGAGGTVDLPRPDTTGTAKGGTSGRIDLIKKDATVVDRLGYGTATTSERSPAPALSSTTSATRIGPCIDTDVNATDFRATEPTPENSTVNKPGCTVIPPPPEPVTIEQIQGTSHTSPYAGKLVTGVVYSGYDHPNAMRVQLDDALLTAGTMPRASVGDSITGDTVGVMDYSFSNPKLEVTNSEFFDQDSDHDPQVVRLAIRGGRG